MKHVTLIGAGAGSGKTYRLAEEVFNSINSGAARPDGILLTTFTKKAATELRSRVTARLIAEGKREDARRIGGSLIGTVHSICAQLLQDFAFELGLAAKVTALDEDASRTLFNISISTGIPEEDQRNLQRIGDLLRLEDWRDTVRALADLVRVNGIDPSTLGTWAERSVESLLDGFLEDKKGRERLDAAVTEAMAALRALIESGADTTKKTKDAVLDLDRASKELKKTTHIVWESIQRLTRLSPAKKAEGLVATVIFLANANYTWPEMRTEMRSVVSSIFSAVEGTLKAYERGKREMGAIDFTDMERMLLDALKRPTVREALAERLDLLMVDEFQDTSPIQMAIFLDMIPLAKKVVWVGDPKQAIYGFRGTDPDLMNAALNKIEAAGTTDRLTHSYRSRPELVQAVNKIFGDAFGPQGQRPKDVNLEATRPAVLSAPALESWILAKVPTEGGRAVQNIGTDHAQISSEIHRILDSKSHQVGDRESKAVRPIEPGDIAILVRSNDSVIALAATLRDFGVPVEVAVPGLLSQPEILWLRAAMELMLNPEDSLKAAQLTWLADVCKAGGPTPERWLEERVKAHRADPRALPWVKHNVLSKIRAAAEDAGSLSPGGLVRAAMRASEAAAFAQRCSLPRLALANLSRMTALAAQYSEGQVRFGQPVTSGGFLNWLDKMAENQEDRIQPIAANAVQICTYHAAKGLEWPMVVLYQLHKEYEAQPFDVRVTSPQSIDLSRPLEGRGVIYWPYMYGRLGKVQNADFAFLDFIKDKTEYGIMARKRQEEELRLLYVAATRARDYLVFAARPEQTQALGVVCGSDGQPALVVPQDLDEVPQGWRVVAPEIKTVDAERAIASDRIWLSYLQSTSKDAGRRTPSDVEGDVSEGQGVTVRDPEVYGARFALHRDTDVTSLGTALHAYLAIDGNGLAIEDKKALLLEVLTAHGCHDDVEADAVLGGMEAFQGWLSMRFPGAILKREVPVHSFDNGVLIEGSIDLLVETDAGFVIIDHKAFPGTVGKAKVRAASHSRQLQEYRAIVERASGKRVIEVGIHMLVSGLYFSVDCSVTAA